MIAGTSGADRVAWSRTICDRVANAEFFAKAAMVMLYAPMLGAGEVDVAPLAAAARRAGKRVCVPRADWKAGTMTPVVVENFEEALVADPNSPQAGLMMPRDRKSVV